MVRYAPLQVLPYTTWLIAPDSADNCATCSGDAEGANEMSYSMGYLRQFCRPFQQDAAATRIFFPDKKVRPSF